MTTLQAYPNKFNLLNVNDNTFNRFVPLSLHLQTTHQGTYCCSPAFNLNQLHIKFSFKI